MIDLSVYSLEERISRVADRFGFFPTRDLLSRNSYFSELVRLADLGSGLEPVYQRLGEKDQFLAAVVGIPSTRQMLAASTIAHDGFYYHLPKIEMSFPGSRKTGGVLIAADLINKKYMPQIAPGKRVKTLYVCPGGIVSTMLEEAKKFLPGYNCVYITSQKRKEDLERAADSNTDLVLLGYELSYRRNIVSYFGDQSLKNFVLRRRLELAGEISTAGQGLEQLERMIGKPRTDLFRKGLPSWEQVIVRIVDEELKQEADTVIAELEKRVFNSSQPYYMIIGEAHNLVSFDSKRAQALSNLFRRADWGVLETGTAVRNQISQMSYLMYLLGFVDEPGSFKRVVKNDPKRVRAALSLYRIEPVINSIQQIDPEVPELKSELVYYNPLPAIEDAYLALLNSGLFDGKERLYLARILLACPERLLSLGADTDFYQRVNLFLDRNSSVFSLLETVKLNRVKKAEELIQEAVEAGEKVLVFCEHDIVDWLTKQLEGYGTRKISQSSSLSLNHDGYSERQLDLIEAATNPDVKVLVSTRGILREGIDCREFTTILEYEETTEPYKREQAIARSHRSGQRSPVKVFTLRAKGIELEESIAQFREWKQGIGSRIYEGPDPTEEELENYLNDVSAAESPPLRSLLNMDSRGLVALVFNSLIGVGAQAFSDQMRLFNNAYALSRHFNFKWESTASANCSRLLCQTIIPQIERKSGSLEKILDGASGPAALARILKKGIINIDLLRHQLEYGEYACEQTGLNNSLFYMGSIHDLEHLVSLEQTTDEVFNPQKVYSPESRIYSSEIDLYVCSLAIYYLNLAERKQFFQQSKRVVKKDKYLVLLLPASKIAQECEPQFLQDITASGFTVDSELSGEYAAKTARNVDTGESVSANSFNPYVIVAQNSGEVRAELLSDCSFTLLPEFEIKEARRKKVEPLSIGKSEPRLVCDDFYLRRQAALPVKSVLNEPPVLPLPEPGLDKQFKDIVFEHGEQAVLDTLRRLSEILK